ncbi:unnamed protein product [Fasciola hepatica]|uniref:Uncharacterized protein n=1 Tax=Fasciola hepatica TaxID=6192 RepID=A0ABC9HG34_FASHE|nr:unnamed protein product [Fasciola hepatica]
MLAQTTLQFSPNRSHGSSADLNRDLRSGQRWSIWRASEQFEAACRNSIRQPPYTSPFRVVKSRAKTFVTNVSRLHDTVAVDSLEPTVFECEPPAQYTPTQDAQSSASSEFTLESTTITPSENSEVSPSESPTVPATWSSRRGCQLLSPVRFADFVTIYTTDC